MKRLFIFGSSNTDFILRVPHFPHEGETLLASHLNIIGGGKGANQARNAARFLKVSDQKIPVYFVGCFGNDPLSLARREELLNDNVLLDYSITTDESAGGTASILLNEKSGDNQITIFPGANHHLLKKDISKIPLTEDDTLLISMEIPLETVNEILLMAAKYHSKIILNPAPMNLTKDLIKTLIDSPVDFLIPNEVEYLALNNILPKNVEAKSLTKNLIITQGKKKIVHINNMGKEKSFTPKKVNAINTIGAGDTFCGVFASLIAIYSEHDVEKAIKISMDVATLKTTEDSIVPSQNIFKN